MRELDKEQKEYVVGLTKKLFKEIYPTCSESIVIDLLKEKGLVEQHKIGKWYNARCCGSNRIYLILLSGFDGVGNPVSNHWFHNGRLNETKGSFDKDLIPATDEEVGEALIKEAKRRELKEGVKVSQINSYNLGNDCRDKWIIDNSSYKFINGILFIGNICLFQDGKWAEIVEEKKSIIHPNIIQQENGETIITIPEGVNFEFKTVE